MKSAKRFLFLRELFSRTKTTTHQQRATCSVSVESLEDRRLMAANLFPINPVPTKETPAVGSITYNASSRIVTVVGSNVHNDNISITVNTRGSTTAADDLLTIRLRNAGVTTAQYNVNNVERIFARMYGGDDTIDNQSYVNLTAYGDAGVDLMLGGTGNDSLIGGTENDFIDGRGGNDTIWGQEGADALFGDSGSDTILGGPGNDAIFGGSDDDYLYGEGDNDRLYGEAGVDRLSDTVGNNVLYTDYGPTATISASGFMGFDWFDKNLKDPELRSLVRLQYRDSLLQRNDVFQVYTQVAADNTVNANELADLRRLTTTSINTSADINFYMNKIAQGDRANQWYKGSALGNLDVGSSGAHLSALVDKWMRGGDLPALPAARNDGYAFVSGSLFVHGASYADVNQRNIGDCYFMAAIGEIAAHRSSIISNMFIDNGDGTFGVRFLRDGVSQFVTVNRYLPVFNTFAVGAGWGGASFDNSNNELWVALAEKAYAQLNESGWIGQDGTNSYEGIDGGQPANVFTQIAGTAAIRSALSKSGIIEASNAGKAIVLTTKIAGTAENVVPNHVYMLLGYNVLKDKFQLFNPWGYGPNPSPNIELSYTELVANFIETTSTVL